MVTTNAPPIRQLHWVPIIFGIVVLCLVAIGAPSQATPASGQDLDTLLSKKQYRQLSSWEQSRMLASGSWRNRNSERFSNPHRMPMVVMDRRGKIVLVNAQM